MISSDEKSTNQGPAANDQAPETCHSSRKLLLKMQENIKELEKSFDQLFTGNNSSLENLHSSGIKTIEQLRKIVNNLDESVANDAIQSTTSTAPDVHTFKNILVTGACGFIGSNFVNYLYKHYKDVNIINLDRLDYCGDKSNVTIPDTATNYKLVVGDVGDGALLMKIFEENQIDTIVHFAAQSHVDNSFNGSIQFTKDNVLAVNVLLDCVKKYGKIKRLQHISTDEVYGEVEMSDLGCTEDRLLNPTNPYAATKAGAEHLVRSFHLSHKIPILITRMNNIYGPRQYPEKLIPKFVQLLEANKKLTIHGKGDARRVFLHTEDVCRGLLCALTKGETGKTYNIGSKNEYSVLEIATKLLTILKPNEKLDDWLQYVEDRAFNDMRYFVDYSKILKLGWKEEVDFDAGLKETVEWYVKKFKSQKN